MRAIFLAATILCFTGLAASAQPSKMNQTQMPPASRTGRDIRGAFEDDSESRRRWRRGPHRSHARRGSPWLDHAINDVGTNPTGWKRQWCAKSVNLWLQRSGKKGCGGNTAISCLSAGRKLDGPTIGALAVMKHHVGIVKEVHSGQVTLVSGNHSGRSGARSVGIGKYARGRVVAYVWPE